MNLTSRSFRRLPFMAAALFLTVGLAACDAADPLAPSAAAPTGDDFIETLDAALSAGPSEDQTAAASASADDVTCTGTIGAISIDGNVIVPSGRRCTLLGTRIDGNVIVNTNATLLARGVEVGGNVQAEGATGVLLRDRNGARSSVGGSVQLNQGFEAGVIKTTVNSDVQVEQNDGRIVLNQNRVDGNMQVNQNTGGVSINRNVIQENLQCQANNPPPTGGGNTAGDKEDQCASL